MIKIKRFLAIALIVAIAVAAIGSADNAMGAVYQRAERAVEWFLGSNAWENSAPRSRELRRIPQAQSTIAVTEDSRVALSSPDTSLQAASTQDTLSSTSISTESGARFEIGDGSNLPDFRNYSTADLGPVLESGCWGEFCWEAGTPAEDVLPLGAFVETDLMGMTFREAVGYLGVTPEDISLDSLSFLVQSRLDDLVLTHLPFLADLPVDAAPAIAALVEGRGGIGGTLGSLVASESVGGMRLTDLANLAGFSTADLGIADTELGSFSEQLSMGDVLAQEVPFAEMAQDLPQNLPVALADVALGTGEANNEADLGRSVTGSNIIGYDHDCDSDSCPHLELADVPGLPNLPVLGMTGKRFFAGTTALVPGGAGCLTGVELTGRNPLGPIFKLVLMGVNEAQGTADFSLFFRFKIICGVSPYVIGPFPAFSAKEKEWVLIGIDRTF